ncbi:hypothetical protein KP509_32G067600 [Ceratopteris richardii]|uniref:Uncharacterized protein n=1 Tax=Ceratopteris richardii TaxID=49495 RepID=A0A8T2QUT2_CERRI|nr:hypothetical protein KP509_32G067600 [Ceratopteris richardii]
MNPTFNELSDDDRDFINVRASRVLGPRIGRPSPARTGVDKLSPSPAERGSLPSIESFAFNHQGHGQNGLDDDDDESSMPSSSRKRKTRKYMVLDESSDEDVDPAQQRQKSAKTEELELDFSTPHAGTSRLVDATRNEDVAICIDTSAADMNVSNDEAIARTLQEEESIELENGNYEGGGLCLHEDDQYVDLESQGAEVDLIGSTLQKCDEIAASLRKELKVGCSSDSAEYTDRYAEIDASAAKIVSQADVSAACRSEDGHLVLKPYQLVGVNFLMLLYRKNVGGAILADEMGLGKTIQVHSLSCVFQIYIPGKFVAANVSMFGQAVSFLAVLNHLDKDPGPHLIICPASLLENWARELKKWCPHFTLIAYHGAERAAHYRQLNYTVKAQKPAPFNVMLTGYSLFERAQQKDDRKLLRKFKWSCVLMDEAHLLKDRSSSRRRHLWALAQKAKQRLLLTGTPLQNDLQELWSLLEFMVPDIFDSGDIDLKKVFGSRNAGGDAQTEDMDLIARIKAILGPFVLRRLKSDVMRQLVAKTQKVELLEMIPGQAQAYKEAIEEYRAAANKARSSKALTETSTNATELLPRRQISNYFTQFRKIANHPLLVRRLYTEADVGSLAKILHSKGAFGFECTLQRVKDELLTYSDYALHRLSASYNGVGLRGALSNNYALGSAKCQALAKLLPRLKEEGHRALIFSQWTGMMDILEWALDVIGLEYLRLDGSTQVAERQTIIDNYNNDQDIFACLLSTRAGGQGLNLTGADTVIIHDMDFNPQMDRQAEDRCHRIGQSKPVTVYRLVTKGTVDEDIYSIAKRKLVLDAAVLESGAEAAAEENDFMTMGAILSAILDPTQQ